jgi:hypothetical protein
LVSISISILQICKQKAGKQKKRLSWDKRPKFYRFLYGKPYFFTMALLFMEEELGPVWGAALERSLKVPCGFRGLKKVLVNGQNHVICKFKLLRNHIPLYFLKIKWLHV